MINIRSWRGFGMKTILHALYIELSWKVHTIDLQTFDKYINNAAWNNEYRFIFTKLAHSNEKQFSDNCSNYIKFRSYIYIYIRCEANLCIMVVSPATHIWWRYISGSCPWRTTYTIRKRHGRDVILCSTHFFWKSVKNTIIDYCLNRKPKTRRTIIFILHTCFERCHLVGLLSCTRDIWYTDMREHKTTAFMVTRPDAIDRMD